LLIPSKGVVKGLAISQVENKHYAVQVFKKAVCELGKSLLARGVPNFDLNHLPVDHYPGRLNLYPQSSEFVAPQRSLGAILFDKRCFTYVATPNQSDINRSDTL
jgi:hypothetical protein